MIEMLFIDSDSRGQGYGSTLIEFKQTYGANCCIQNIEQNPLVLVILSSQGFRVIEGMQTDDVGRPYPILHLFTQKLSELGAWFKKNKQEYAFKTLRACLIE